MSRHHCYGNSYELKSTGSSVGHLGLCLGAFEKVRYLSARVATQVPLRA